ncbi:MAG TPA: hypothetical protein LFV92_06850 [Rickettsia endosymbiont of Ceroptres masudai]|nr:hypothetical protein [Rickettsia endosymbiont of Ceroptres masudai]
MISLHGLCHSRESGNPEKNINKYSKLLKLKARFMLDSRFRGNDIHEPCNKISNNIKLYSAKLFSIIRTSARL